MIWAKTLPTKAVFTCFLLFLWVIVPAQYNPNNGFLDAHFGKPITFSSRDSSFTLGIGGRIQSMAESRYDLQTEKGTIDFYIRRLRLNFSGNAISQKFTYRIQLCFSQRDVASDNSLVPNNFFLRDAMLYYSPNKHWRFGFGQTKLPGNRQRQTSSGNLQFADRSNTNALFTLDRDKGFWIVNTIRSKKKLIVSNTLAITSGEGRINSDKTAGLCYSARSEILPLGEFKNNGDYVESDLFFEEKLKLSVGFSYSFNNKTSRVAGQLGESLYNNQLADIHYYGTDIVMKKKGWSFTGELYRRTSKNGISINPSTSKVNFVYSGTGLLLQSGYLFTKKDEFAVRYGRTSPDKKVTNYTSQLNEYMLAYSHYFFRHNLKLQTDAAYFKGPAQKALQWRFTGIVTF
ncbi:MAG: porin [Bacteroidota bacterium]|nr:porin [Bacteroidota bacterium]